MGQKEILEFLSKYPTREFTKSQIEEALCEEKGHTCASLVQLRRNGEIEYRKGPSPPSWGRNVYYYKHKKTEEIKIILRVLAR